MGLYYEKISLHFVVNFEDFIDELFEGGLPFPVLGLPVPADHGEVGTVVGGAHVAGLFGVLEAEQGHFVVVQRDVAVAAQHLLLVLAPPLLLLRVVALVDVVQVFLRLLLVLLLLLELDHFVLQGGFSAEVFLREVFLLLDLDLHCLLGRGGSGLRRGGSLHHRIPPGAPPAEFVLGAQQFGLLVLLAG